jgi:hypothetical protein
MDFSSRTDRELAQALQRSAQGEPSTGRRQELRIEVGSGGLRSIRDVERLVSGIRVITELGAVAAQRQLEKQCRDVWKSPSDQLINAIIERSPGLLRFEERVDGRNGLRRYQEYVPEQYRFDRERRRPFREWVDLDEFDRELYDAACAATVEALLPEPLLVRKLRYGSPLRALLKIPKLGTRTAAAAVRVTKDVRDWEAEKTVAEASARRESVGAARAERTLDAQVEADVERLKLENDRLRLENERILIENARSSDDLNYERLVRQLVLSAATRGDLELAETYRQLTAPDVSLLRSLSTGGVTAELVGVEESEES